MDTYPLAHISKIFDSKCENLITDDTRDYVSPELWKCYLEQFKWLFYEFGKLQCKTCQIAYKKDPLVLECDEWTCSTDYNIVIFNKDNLILILKIHNFSENHLRAENILTTSKVIEVLSIEYSEKALSLTKWERFQSRFPWLYIRQENPACMICERAVEVSKTIPFTKWSDRSSQLLIKAERTYRILVQHGISKYHKTSEEVVRGSFVGEGNPPTVFTEYEWQGLVSSFPWLYYRNHVYHCTQCEETHNSSDESGPLVNLSLEARSREHLTQEIASHHGCHIDSLVTVSCDTSVSISTDDDKINDVVVEEVVFVPSLNESNWYKLIQKYSWLIGENGWSYGCKVCQAGRKLDSRKVAATKWTEEMIPFSLSVNYTYLTRRCYQHSVRQGHLVAKAVLENHELMSLQSSLSCGEEQLPSTVSTELSSHGEEEA